jgi:hypothetical protein
MIEMVVGDGGSRGRREVVKLEKDGECVDIYLGDWIIGTFKYNCDDKVYLELAGGIEDEDIETDDGHIYVEEYL